MSTRLRHDLTPVRVSDRSRRRRSRWRTAVALAASTLPFGGCTGVQSALDATGASAARIAELWWVMFGLGTAVFLAVTAFLLVALFRRRTEQEGDESRRARRATRLMCGGVGATVLILLVTLVYSIYMGRETSGIPDPRQLTIEVIGHQWWWEVRYLDPDPSRMVVTANEIYLPVGQPVLVKLRTQDVIHSFWVPNLAGKTDLIPGRENVLTVRADRPGVSRGQCAEYCGLQHAHMGLMVIAQTAAEFAQWLEDQRRPAVTPTDSVALRGQQVFLTGPCVMCHRIRGTDAGGSVAPDLTHLASRRTLAAATIPNTRGHLAAWILDPQHIKPGNRMPPTNLDGGSLQALLSYLESLK